MTRPLLCPRGGSDSDLFDKISRRNHVTIKKICENSFSRVIHKAVKKYNIFRGEKNSEITNDPLSDIGSRMKFHVKTFSELYEDALNNAGREFTEAYNKTIEK